MTNRNDEEVLPLDALEQHGWAVVKAVDAADADMDRLMAMGLCVGRTIELVLKGDPLIVRVFGSRIGMSARLATRVLVSPCREDRCPLPKGGMDAPV